MPHTLSRPQTPTQAVSFRVKPQLAHPQWCLQTPHPPRGSSSRNGYPLAVVPEHDALLLWSGEEDQILEMSPNSLVRVWGAFGAPSVSFSFLFHRTQATVKILERLYGQRYCAMNGFGHAAPLRILWLLEIVRLESRNTSGIPRRE